ncbi:MULTISPECIES: TRAP transporter small permease [unclassified Modicisalibacter]|uniref:TRAP transporter small permease n=1 Tax=unclassified Modicisalibacter TaxID=2679913 RepID=UPI001CCA5D68|nr:MULTISPECIES: TRAP transporter small permease [unclassified Modicisalibacter]MBZ9557795.1 TRAP transporter small permease [Modicisalibacter sp. R2A 31.J]MBZ9573540.1 TRAP transporter small permease [Modicisalibacter sp. MOD 31.J]
MTQEQVGTTLARRLLSGCCQGAATLGGLMVLAMAVMTVCSIAGRWIAGAPYLGALPWLDGIGPVTGDYEIVQMGTATAVFLFLPYCHLRGGHVTVDLLVMHAPRMIQRATAILAETLFMGVSALMTWRLFHGLLDKQRYMETSMLLGIPLWWGYAAGIVGFALLTLVCLYRSIAALTANDQHDTLAGGPR